MSNAIIHYSPDNGPVMVATGDHLFWFPKPTSTLGRCKKCKLIVTRKEAEHRNWEACIKVTNNEA